MKYNTSVLSRPPFCDILAIK